MERAALAIVAVVGVPLALVGYLALGEFVLTRVPRPTGRRLRPWLWLGPAVSLLGLFLVYPTVQTAYLSFLDSASARPVGLANYQQLLTDPSMGLALRNSLTWVVVFPLITVVLGLAIALLADRVPYDGAARGVVFLPMAVSFVAAGVVWKLMFDYRPSTLEQTGLVNAVLMRLVPGFEPQASLVNGPPLNTLALIVAAAWVWTGFCTVVLSAALKGVPAELLEAARVDGASELQVVRHVVLPSLAPAIVVVVTTMIIFALKAFDIVYVMTSGNYGTEVIASRMYREMFNVRDFGRASAVAVMLLLAITPAMLLNIRRFRQEGQAMR